MTSSEIIGLGGISRQSIEPSLLISKVLISGYLLLPFCDRVASGRFAAAAVSIDFFAFAGSCLGLGTQRDCDESAN